MSPTGVYGMPVFAASGKLVGLICRCVKNEGTAGGGAGRMQTVSTQLILPAADIARLVPQAKEEAKKAAEAEKKPGRAGKKKAEKKSADTRNRPKPKSRPRPRSSSPMADFHVCVANDDLVFSARTSSLGGARPASECTDTAIAWLRKCPARWTSTSAWSISPPSGGAKEYRRAGPPGHLPAGHAALRVSAGEKEVEVALADRRWVFPRDNCLLLPVANTTTELLAQYVAERLAEWLASHGAGPRRCGSKSARGRDPRPSAIAGPAPWRPGPDQPICPSAELLRRQAAWLAPARARLLRRAEIARRRRVLDLACGPGTVVEELVQRSGGSVVALDCSRTALAAVSRNGGPVPGGRLRRARAPAVCRRGVRPGVLPIRAHVVGRGGGSAGSPPRALARRGLGGHRAGLRRHDRASG